MEKEISSGAMLGIVLIALAAIIGLGFGVFAIAKGTANQGVTDVQENLESVSQSAYTDFDQTIVTGTQVKSAYQNFEGKSVAVLVATQAVKDNLTGSAEKVRLKETAAGIKASFGTADSVPMVDAYSGKDSDGKLTNKLGWTTSSNTAVTMPAFINYNALLASPDSAEKYSKDGKDPYVYFDNNCYKTDLGYCAAGGKVKFNNVSGNMSKSGMIEFLPTSARFQAYLLKDMSGTTMGVVFEQISSK